MNEPVTFLDSLPRIMLYTGTWIAGSVFIRRYAEHGAPGDFAASIAASAFGMALAVPLLKTAGLGITMGITSALYLMAMAAVGALVFGERIMPVQSAGIALACVAVILMAVPSYSRSQFNTSAETSRESCHHTTSQGPRAGQWQSNDSSIPDQ